MDDVLIIGGNGFLGSYLAAHAKMLNMRVGIVGTAQSSAVLNTAYYRADIGDADAMQAVFRAAAPRYVINAAAIADIDYAEQNQSEALCVNATGAQICAELAQRHHARHLFFSSDAVFDGEKDSYTESAATAPCNYYGKTKELAEQAVLRANPQAVIARVSLLLGRSEKNSGVIDPVWRKLESGGTVLSNADQIRTPIDGSTLAQAAFELLAMQDFYGLIHLASTEAASKLEICRRIALQLGFDPDRVQPYPEGSAQGAERHKNGVLSVKKAALVLQQTHMLALDETIARAVMCPPPRCS